MNAKLSSAEAQLELAKNVGEGEGQIAKEIAEYRISVGNALTSALIDMGIDEATAFQLATAAMAENEEEFANVAKGCFENMDDNAAKAAYNMAHAIFVNANRSCESIADIAAQAHETAEAISAMGDGRVAGSAIPRFNGLDGTQVGGLSLDLYSGNFNGTEYDYDARALDLEEYVSQLELDISAYQDAISQIDGQIATLKALKNLPLSSFKSESSSSGSSSNSSTKEIEEYTATIEDYREAVERLRKAQEDASNIETAIDESDDLNEKIALEKQLISAYQSEQEALHILNGLRSNTITEGVAALRELGFAVEYNADANELWISNMERLNELTADSKGEYDTLQEATNVLRKDTEDLIGTLEDLNEENRKGSSTWRELKNSIKDAKVAIVNDLQEIVDKASDAVDEIQNVADTLYDAADEFAANDGFITIDTWQALRKVGMQYMQLLKDENGVYEINEERINAVIAARTRQMAVENAMSYVERIKLATQEGSIESLNDLIFVTTDATNSTWGLVYAELELMHTMGDLNDSQYQAALHNIQAMQDLAENAIQNIGKATDAVATNLENTRKQLEETKDGLRDLLDELEDMQDGAGDLVDYVMDMLEDRIKQQTDALNDAKKAVKEYIDQLKEAMKAQKDESKYEDEVAEKLKAIAKLQAKIDALSLDDSRKAQAEKITLEEELAELQKDLADYQADHALDVTEDALDKQYDAYEEEKDAEIDKLEESISSTQKLYDMAIEYIRNNWDTLYSELIQWNYEAGTSLNTEITAAWEAAQAAAQRYGDFVSAIMGGVSNEIDSVTKQIEAIDTQISSLSTSSSSGSGSNKNTVVGTSSNNTSYSNEDAIHAAIKEMYQNAQAWHSASKAEQEMLDKRNLALGAQLSSLGANARRDNGTWYDGNELLFEKYKKYIYHTGGFVGDKPLKPNERYIKAENGELVLTSDQQDSLAAQFDKRIDNMKRIADVFRDPFGDMPISAKSMWPDGVVGGTGSSVSNIVNNSQPTEIHMGDIIINAPSGDGKVIADEVRKITRENMNEISRMLRRP